MKNTVELLRKDLCIHYNGKLFDAEQINHRSKVIKNQIFNFFSGSTQKKHILIYTNDLTIVLPSIRATWELGASIVVHDYNPGWESHPSFIEFYSYIDLVLLPPTRNYPEKISLPNLVLDLNSEQELDLTVDVDLSWPAAITHTSGTTGIPKPIEISHQDAINLVKKNIEVFEFNETDKILHFKTLHHGSLFLNYAIPTMAKTKEHYFITKSLHTSNKQFLDAALKFCKNNLITTWLIPYNWIRLIPDLESQYDLNFLKLITVLGPTSDEMVQIFDKIKVKEIFNNFGCTEVGSLFLSRTNQDNVDEYNPNRFYIVNNDIVDLEFYSTYFKVKHKNSLDWNIIGDVFEIDSNNIYWWRGRCNIINNQNKYIQVSEIAKFLEQYFVDLNFSLVPDFELDKLYLAVFGQKTEVDPGQLLSELNKKLVLITESENTIHSIDYFSDNFIMGMKPSQPLLLYSFRKKNETF